MSKRSRRIWTGVAAACMAAAIPALVQAQEYLPPVIDRSSGAGQAAPAPQAVPKATVSLEERVSKLERLLDNKALVDMLMRLDDLQNENQDLRGQVETFGHEMAQMKQRQRDLYLDMDRRLRDIEVKLTQLKSAPSATAAAPATPGAGVTAPAMPSAPGSGVAPAIAGGAATTAAAAAAPADPAAERDAYQKAFDLLKQGQYDKAITAFHSFLSSYPHGDYSDNAQYWLGEANYVTRHFDAAEQEFRKVLDQYPDSSKVSDAMLKLGYTYYELGNWDAARKTLEDVKSRFPNTTVGRLADNRLQKMRLEGR